MHSCLSQAVEYSRLWGRIVGRAVWQKFGTEVWGGLWGFKGSHCQVGCIGGGRRIRAPGSARCRQSVDVGVPTSIPTHEACHRGLPLRTVTPSLPHFQPSTPISSHDAPPATGRPRRRAGPDAHTRACSFKSKLDTDLFDLVKAKTTALSVEASRDGRQLAMFCADRRVRVLRFQ
eukprot:308308-Chlamydomonas_euryale.AAC.1